MLSQANADPPQMLCITCGSVRIRRDPSGSVRENSADPSWIRCLLQRKEAFWKVVLVRECFLAMCLGILQVYHAYAIAHLEVFLLPSPLPRVPSALHCFTTTWCRSCCHCIHRVSIPCRLQKHTGCEQKDYRGQTPTGR